MKLQRIAAPLPHAGGIPDPRPPSYTGPSEQTERLLQLSSRRHEQRADDWGA